MILFLLLACFSSLLFYNYYWKRRSYPPGPAPLPLIGNLIELKSLNYYDALLKWKREFGPMFTFWMGEVPVVCFADYDTIQETLVKEADTFGGRFTFGRLSIVVREEARNVGIVDADSRDVYLDQRKFILRTFREFGVGKNIMQEKILNEYRHLQKDIEEEQHKDGSVDVMDRYDYMVGSIICGILFGRRYGEDPDDLEYKDILGRHLQLFLHPLAFIFAYCPSDTIANMYPMSWARDEAARNGKFMMGFARKEIRQHEEKFKRGIIPSPPTDLIDAFLCEVYKENAGENFHTQQLENLIFDVFIAGLETTSNTLGFITIEIMRNPTIQEKIHAELDRVIGSDRIIDLSDKNDLTYINAVLAEGLRYANVLALNLTHKNTREVTVRGHTIPQGTCIQPLICAVLYDEKLFPDPKTFKPERFIAEDGSLINNPHLIAFSAGRRQCLGEGLAKTELFLVFANLFNQFKISCVDPKNPPSNRKNVGVTTSPSHFKAVFERRF
ncbi:unnamed protein product [Bursaphelenchus xylophilus]|uniref:(pine wood nematode) hypothetical protein n=1 Tax=Bursaphelenchus xylophilus TaxID=6326 RepID=A0A1I7RJ64_BURXY|nr:unnamed protein product [Bursaphelenchus xylophilus]CAG9119400.1 unnamed protein product [Bursaphelenchus xylophilus]